MQDSANNDEPRAWTAEEVATKLIKCSIGIADYWAGLPDKAPKEMTRGTVFSMFAMLDGSNIGLPAFSLVPDPHESDREYCISEGENYFTPEPISLSLHEMFHEIEQAFDERKSKI